MIDMISSFLECVNGRISLHRRMIYTHPVAEKVKGFDRHGKANLQMDTLLGNLQKYDFVKAEGREMCQNIMVSV